MLVKQHLIDFWRDKNIVSNENIFHAFQNIPREHFLPSPLKQFAYHDHPLPTMRDQSISQPTTIMIMLQALDPQPGHSVFEVGAGVGYQAALLSHIVGNSGKVITTDILPELIHTTRQNLQTINRTNVKVLESDGAAGYEDAAPYDRVIITCACSSIPQPLIDQLKDGGIIVAPVGDLEQQTMVKGTKRGFTLDLEFLGDFRFVPMRGKYGFKD